MNDLSRLSVFVYGMAAPVFLSIACQDIALCVGHRIRPGAATYLHLGKINLNQLQLSRIDKLREKDLSWRGILE